METAYQMEVIFSLNTKLKGAKIISGRHQPTQLSSFLIYQTSLLSKSYSSVIMFIYYKHKYSIYVRRVLALIEGTLICV